VRLGDDRCAANVLLRIGEVSGHVAVSGLVRRHRSSSRFAQHRIAVGPRAFTSFARSSQAIGPSRTRTS
jgi:hypothetical protein